MICIRRDGRCDGGSAGDGGAGVTYGLRRGEREDHEALTGTGHVTARGGAGRGGPRDAVHLGFDVRTMQSSVHRGDEGHAWVGDLGDDAGRQDLGRAGGRRLWLSPRWFHLRSIPPPSELVDFRK